MSRKHQTFTVPCPYTGQCSANRAEMRNVVLWVVKSRRSWLISEEYIASILRMLEVVSSSETLVTIYKAKRCHDPETRNPHHTGIKSTDLMAKTV
jgi:hypothetical protein